MYVFPKILCTLKEEWATLNWDKTISNHSEGRLCGQDGTAAANDANFGSFPTTLEEEGEGRKLSWKAGPGYLLQRN